MKRKQTPSVTSTIYRAIYIRGEDCQLSNPYVAQSDEDAVEAARIYCPGDDWTLYDIQKHEDLSTLT